MSIFSRLTKTNSTGAVSLQNNLTATSAPTVTDDTSEGYAVGSLWIDVTGDEAYRCVDATEGSAVWVKTTLDATEFATVMASTINSATGKTTPVDADEMALVDSEASNVLKKLTWANLKATLVTYFDTLYAGVLGADENYVSDAELTVLQNTSGTNTGDNAGLENLVEDATPQLGGNLDLNDKKVDYDAVPATDAIGVGITTSAFTLGATIAVGELVYLGSGGKWLKADASAVGTAGTVLLGICLTAGDDTDPTSVLLQGMYRDDTQFALTVGAEIYASETAGDFTETAPTTADAVVRVVGHAVSADVLYFNPSSDHITVTG